MRFPTFPSLPALPGFSVLATWWQLINRRYETDYNALAGAANSGITAAGTTQATAQALQGSVNVLTTVAANSGVSLPPFPSPTQQIMIVNAGAHTVKVYPPLAGQINALGTNAAFSLTNGKILVGYYVSQTQFWGGLLS